MWDGWETGRGSLRRVPAELSNYRRAFSKASVRNWGTAKHPGPTLNLVRAEAKSCYGMAFEFPENRRDAILGYLTEREGRGFALRELPIRPQGETETRAVVPLYEGRNIIATDRVQDLAAMVIKAEGSDGPCTNYVKGISDELRRLNIDDPVVTELWRAVEKAGASTLIDK
jgi:cation transport protein ChaC